MVCMLQIYARLAQPPPKNQLTNPTNQPTTNRLAAAAQPSPEVLAGMSEADRAAVAAAMAEMELEEQAAVEAGEEFGWLVGVVALLAGWFVSRSGRGMVGRGCHGGNGAGGAGGS